MTAGGGGATRSPSVARSELLVRFRGDPERIRECLLPPPLESVGDGDVGLAAVSDVVVPGTEDGGDGTTPPTTVTEAAVGAPCRYDGRRRVVYPIRFVDRPTGAFDRGVTRGVGDVAKTKWHSACPTRRSISAGDSAAATASHRGEKLLDVDVDVEREVDPDALPAGVFAPVYHRYLPDPLADGAGGALANDLTAVGVDALSVGSVWTGTPTLSFGDWKGGLLSGLSEAALDGYHVTAGYEFGRDATLAGVDPEWGDHVE
jgi:hypothetical protein